MNPVAGDTQEGNLSESVAESPQGAAPVARHRLRVGSLFSGYGGAEMAVQARMQGLPAGHVTAVPGVSRVAALKMLGNGIVPQQMALALRLLLDADEVAA